MTCQHPRLPVLAPCPDNKPGCIVCHYDKNSWVCPDCEEDMAPVVRDMIKNGGFTTVIGQGCANIKGILKLDLRRGGLDPLPGEEDFSHKVIPPLARENFNDPETHGVVTELHADYGPDVHVEDVPIKWGRGVPCAPPEVPGIEIKVTPIDPTGPRRNRIPE